MRALALTAALLAGFGAWLYREAGAPGSSVDSAATADVAATASRTLPPLPIAAASLTPPMLPSSPAAPPPLAAEERGFLTPP